MAGPKGTDIGGERGDFPSTMWGGFLTSFGADPGAARMRLETLALTYWKPVYVYLRARWSKSNEDAKDLTQDFFLWIMESDFVSRYDKSRGRFRSFLKASLDHYATDVERERRTLKRGGGKSFMPLEGSVPVISGTAEPSQILDEAWRSDLMERGVAKLEEVLRAEGKEIYFKIFREYFLVATEPTDYKTLAAKFGVEWSDVSNHIMHAKRRFRSILKELVTETVESPEDLHGELAWLLGEDA